MTIKKIYILSLFFITLITAPLKAEVQVNNIADFMVHNSTEEGYAGPGFFISTNELQSVSKSMKKKLGINSRKQVKSNNNITVETLSPQQKQHKKTKYLNTNSKQSFQEVTHSFHTSITSPPKTKSFSETTVAIKFKASTKM